MLGYEFKILLVRDEAALVGEIEETPNALAAAFPVIEGPVVDVHADEFVGEVAAHVAGVLEGVLHGFGPMIEAVLDAAGQEVGDFFAVGGGKAFMDDIASKRQGQPILGAVPPDAEVFAKFQPLVPIGELAFVYDEADVGAAFADRLEDFVEWHDDGVDLVVGFFEPKLEREEGAGHFPRHGDFFAGNFLAAETLFGDEHRAVAVAHASTAGQECILPAHIGVGVDADGGDIKFAAGGALVKGLDILEDVLEFEAFAAEVVLGERVEHKGVIRVR